jgi:Leucine-rich repeat (LRR) protein
MSFRFTLGKLEDCNKNIIDKSYLIFDKNIIYLYSIIELDISELDLLELPCWIKKCINLKKLYCGYNGLEILSDELPNSLQYLSCVGNKLAFLPKLPENLEILECNDNKLLCLPKLPKSLKEIDCSNNKIECLPNLPNSLEILNCENNQLKKIEKFPQSLKYIFFGGNKIEKIKLNCKNLEIMCSKILKNEKCYVEYTGNKPCYDIYAIINNDLIR